MTNTLHRQGAPGTLKNDFVIFAHTAKGINREGSASKLREFMRICLRHKPVNIGDGKQGNIYQDDIDIEELICNQRDASGATAVFTDLDTLQKVIEDLIRADLGLSINVSGLLEEVKTCCRRAGIQRHSAEHSLGFWGAKDRLPERHILEISTMCGHGMVSFNFIRKLIELVKLRRLTPGKAARIMAKCCECGAFNPARAQVLMEKVRQGG